MHWRSSRRLQAQAPPSFHIPIGQSYRSCSQTGAVRLHRLPILALASCLRATAKRNRRSYNRPQHERNGGLLCSSQGNWPRRRINEGGLCNGNGSSPAVAGSHLGLGTAALADPIAVGTTALSYSEAGRQMTKSTRRTKKLTRLPSSGTTKGPMNTPATTAVVSDEIPHVAQRRRTGEAKIEAFFKL